MASDMSETGNTCVSSIIPVWSLLASGVLAAINLESNMFYVVQLTFFVGRYEYVFRVSRVLCTWILIIGHESA